MIIIAMAIRTSFSAQEIGIWTIPNSRNSENSHSLLAAFFPLYFSLAVVQVANCKQFRVNNLPRVRFIEVRSLMWCCLRFRSGTPVDRVIRISGEKAIGKFCL